MARTFLNHDTVYISKVYREITTQRVLTTEFIDNIKVSLLDQLEEDGYDRKLITRRGADILLTQVFEHGFFHADPSPGNLFVLPNNVICLLELKNMESMLSTHDQISNRISFSIIIAVRFLLSKND